MTDTIINHVIQILLPVLATALTGIFSWIGITVKNTFEGKIKSETAKSVVNDAVKYVEQVFTDFQGPEKLGEAVLSATQILNEKGIDVSSSELRVLIESSVNGLNQVQNSEPQNSNAEENVNTEVPALPSEDGSYTEEIMTPEMASTTDVPDIGEDAEEDKEQEIIENPVEGGL
jgi:hypothetical protein